METQSAADVGRDGIPAGTAGQDGSRPDRLDRLALAVSYILNPLLVFSLCFFLYYFLDWTQLSLLYGALHLGSLIVLFACYFFVLKLLGKPLDFELRNKADRSWPLGVTVGALILLGIFYWRVTNSGMHVYTNVASSAMILTFWVATRYTKVSLHSFASCFALSALFFIARLDLIFLPLVLLGPVVMWARMRLRYHTLGQSLAGAALGIVSILFLAWLQMTDPLGIVI